MAVEVQYRDGTTAEHATFTGVASELTVDTTKHTVVVHDGAKQGGYPLAKEDLSNVPVFGGATSGLAGTRGRIPTPAIGDQNKVLLGNGTWGNQVVQINSSTGTTYTLGLTDAESYLRLTNIAAKTLTVPANSAVAFPIGTTIAGISVGIGQLTVAAGSGVTINTPETLRLRPKAFVSFVLTKVGTDEWDLAGDLEAA